MYIYSLQEFKTLILLRRFKTLTLLQEFKTLILNKKVMAEKFHTVVWCQAISYRP